MGYRSVVEIALYPTDPEDFAMLKLYVEEHLPDKFEVKGGKRKVLHLRLEDVKWYPSYEEVQTYTRCFANWEDIFGERCQYEFIRIGEDLGDVEHECSGGTDWLMRVCTVIENDF
jgi:hypothetical protein